MIDNVMDNSKKFTLSDEELAALEAEEGRLLDHYGYGHTHAGLSAWNREWLKNKGWLLYWMSKHPKYVKGKYQIVFSSDYNRPFSSGGLSDFCEWAKENIKATPVSEYGPFSGAEYDEMADDIRNGLNCVNQARFYLPSLSCNFGGGLTYADMEREIVNIHAAHAAWNKKFIMGNDGKVYIRRDVDNDELKRDWFDAFSTLTSPFLTQEDADCLNEAASKCGINLNARSGQKITKVAQKFCVAIGIDKVKHLRLDYVSGRVRDYGFNKHIAELGDAVNPLKVKRYTVLSANPIDYLTMSFGNSWSSCHTIDKENQRGRAKNGSHTYGGSYSSGTLSYMLDGASLIYYQVDGSESPENLELKDKMCREVFCLGHEKMIASRIYPFGRDDEGKVGTASIQVQVRNVVEQIVADMFNCDNRWTIAKGKSACHAVTKTIGTHFPDYVFYDDGVVCYLNKGDGQKDKTSIEIGHSPICPICGHTHSDSNWITCGGGFDECDNDEEIEVHICAECGAVIEDSTNAVLDDEGNWYCDETCAHDAGCTFCDDGIWHLHHVYKDSNGNYFYDPNEEHIIAADGTMFRNAYDAYLSDYVHDANNVWHSVEDEAFCESCQQWVSVEEYDAERGMCTACIERENANV